MWVTPARWSEQVSISVSVQPVAVTLTCDWDLGRVWGRGLEPKPHLYLGQRRKVEHALTTRDQWSDPAQQLALTSP